MKDFFKEVLLIEPKQHAVPVVLDPVYGYASGQDNRRKRRARERENKKNG